LTRKTLKRIASLSAVGAGAVVATADQAEASIIYSGPITTNNTVGWTSSGAYGEFARKVFVGSVSAGSFAFKPWSRHNAQTGTRSIYAIGFNGLDFAGNSRLNLYTKGVSWHSPAARGTLLVNGRVWSVSTTPWATSNGNRGRFTDQYALFTFNFVDGPHYGWIELSGYVSGSYGTDLSYGPSVTVEGYAYEQTPGVKIQAGDTGAVPEPGSFALTGLAALALGAAGTRRWRAARKA
jgi:hypothetical protein